MGVVFRACLLRATLILVLSVGAPVAGRAGGPAEVLASFRKAEQLQKEGRLVEATAEYERTVALTRAAAGEGHSLLALPLHNLGALYQRTGQYAKAEPVLLRSLQIYESTRGPEHPDVAFCLNTLGTLYRSTGQYPKAEAALQRSLRITETRLAKDHPDVASSLYNLAELYQDLGRYTDAEPLYRRSLQIWETKLGKDHLRVGYCLYGLSTLYLRTGQYAKAEPMFRRVQRIWEAELGADHADLAFCLDRLGELYRGLGEYARAEPLLRRGLHVRENKLGQNHPLVADSADTLGELYRGMGQYARAEALYRRSLQIREAGLGKNHPAVALSFNRLAGLYRDQGRPALAEPLYRRSLEINETKLGKDHPAVAKDLNDLAIIDRALGEYARAEAYVRRALQIWEKQLGTDHPAVAGGLHALAGIYQDLGQYAEAEPLYHRSLRIWESKLGESYPNVADSLYGLVDVYAARGETEEATRALDRARHVTRLFTRQVLPLLSDQEQQDFLLQKEKHYFARALSFGRQNATRAEVRARTAAWLLNGKALAQEARADVARRTSAGHDPKVAEIDGELREVRRELARLMMAAPPAGQERAVRERLQALAGRDSELAGRVARLGERTERADPWIDLDELCRRLPAASAYIDIARFDVYDFRANDPRKPWRAARYVAWLILPGNRVESVDLGEAAPIDALVGQFRKALAGAPDAVRTEGEPAAEKEARAALTALAERVLHPLLPHIGKSERWVLCPDGDLWLVPWQALPLPDGAYAVEKHTISYVTSGRDLVTAAVRPKVARSPALVLADPDYDRGGPAALVREDEPWQLRALSFADLLKGAVPRLPGTAAEAQAIAPKLKQYTKGAPRVLLREKAVKSAVRDVLNPSVLVLSTHGFFLPAPRDKGTLDNPLLRCGLLFAGCNDKQAPEQGILTGLEVVGTDLRGTDLVVLSACETALGDVQQGEGVAGLRQCFQLAGADAVVATLWQVPDRATAQQMARFFDLLAAGKGKAEALAMAQRELIVQRRKEFGAAHPFFWAAFTVTGEADRAGDLPPPVLPPSVQDIDRALVQAIGQGAALYNDRNDAAGCCKLYRDALLAARQALADRPELRTAIDQGLARTDALASLEDRAFALREVMDRIHSELVKSP